MYKSMDEICFLSKNLYNYCLFRIKNEFETTGKWIRYYDLEKELRTTKQIDYISLPNNSSQQIIKKLDDNLKSYFKLIKKWKKDKKSLTGCPRFPHFKDKTKGRNLVIFTSVQFRFKDNTIFFPKKSKIKPIKTKIKEGTKINQVRVIPRYGNYVIEIIYEFNEKINENLNNEWLSIDLGVNNLGTCVTTKGDKPFIINGRPLKSINQYYNKKKGDLQSRLGYYLTRKGERKQFSNSRKITKLTNKRNNKIKDYLHKSSKIIVDYCIKNDINNIVLGKNKNWKQEINIGKRNNQNFVDIPFNLFESYLIYKSQMNGINIQIREESYTSKCSSLDLEPIKKHENYLGKRVKRGLFRTKNKVLINSDVNGSINILRKEIGDEWLNPFLINRGFVVNPLKVQPL